jgi:hypothetical protein
MTDVIIRSARVLDMDSGGASVFTLPMPLDIIGDSATGAWSTRKVRAAYAGNCLNIRRDSDNATQNIGFGGNNVLDVRALLSFVGSANGFVTTWYDQSGNGRDVGQSTAAVQPQLVSNGVLLTNLNGTPSIWSGAPGGDTDAGGGIYNMDSTGAGFHLPDLISSGVAGPAGQWTVYAGVQMTGYRTNAAVYHQGFGIMSDFNQDLWGMNQCIGDSVMVGVSNPLGNDVQAAVTGLAEPLNAVVAGRLDAAHSDLRSIVNGTQAKLTTSIVPSLLGTMPFGLTRGADSLHFNGYITEAFTFAVSNSIGTVNTFASNLATYIGTTWTPIT